MNATKARSAPFERRGPRIVYHMGPESSIFQLCSHSAKPLNLDDPACPRSRWRLGRGLFHKWDPNRVFVIITVFLDESGTHGAPLMTIGAFVGRLGQWVDFDRKWKALFKRNDAEYFHSKSLLSSKHHFKGWSFQKKAIFMQDAAKIADKHTLYAFTVMLKADDY